jgi:hypothetical protein
MLKEDSETDGNAWYAPDILGPLHLFVQTGHLGLYAVNQSSTP